MPTFEETPQVVFEVKDEEDNVVYRDAITYTSMSELRNDSVNERQAKFQARYDAWLLLLEESQNAPPQDMEEPVEEV